MNKKCNRKNITESTRKMTRKINTDLTRNRYKKVTRMMQINLNHTQAAQDLLTQWSLEKEIEVAAVQES